MRTDLAGDLELQVVALMNAERAAAGLEPLKVAPQLNAAAQDHSDWMAEGGGLSHAGAGGSDVADRVAAVDFPLTGDWKLSENLAYVSTAQEVDEAEISALHSGLMGSASHRANILDPDLSYVGIGLSVGEIDVAGAPVEAVFLTQNFAETDARVEVQEEQDGETVLQDYAAGEPVGAPVPVATTPEAEEAQEREDAEDDAPGGGGGCFVATAAYGGQAHPAVRDLRRFRDAVLLRHRAGRAFVRVYARLGPRLARFVAPDRISGRLARALIGPLARLAAWWMRRGDGG